MSTLKSFVRFPIGWVNQTLAKLSKWSRRERILLVAALAALGFQGMVFAVFRPLSQEFTRMDQEVLIKETQLLRHKRSISQEGLVDKRYQALKSQVEIPQGTEDEVYSRMLQDVEQAARGRGVTVSDIKPLLVTRSVGMAQFSLRIQAESNMQNLAAFIHTLLSSKKLYQIDSLEIAAKGEDRSKLGITATVRRIVPD